MLHVLLDASALSDSSARRGVGTYVRGLTRALAARDDVTVTALADPGVELPDGIERAPIGRRIAPRRLAAREIDLRQPREIARFRGRADVLLVPSVRPPRRSVLPMVQVLHDVIPLVHPDPLYEPARRQWRAWGSRYRDADAVAAVSRASADAGIEVLGLDPAKVHVVLNGLTPPAPAAVSGSGSGSAPAGAPYLLVASTWSPSKGFGEAMAVVGALADTGYPHRLLIAGEQDPFGRARVAELQAASPHPERIEVLGWVDDLSALYRGAAAVLVPSHVEGFGFPAAEAMAHGAPVVAFRNSSLPEVVGDAGVLVPDRDVAAMAAAVRRIVDDPAEAGRLRAAGPARAATFRWEDTAEQLVDLGRRVVAARSAS